MKVIIAGSPYEYEEGKLLVHEARAMKKHTGMGAGEWAQAMEKGDPDAIVGLCWLVKRRAGEFVKWSDFDDLDLLSVQIEGEEEDGDDEGDDENPTEHAEEDEPTPKKPVSKSRSGTSQKSVTSSTSSN